jgi:hypothetical protein
MICWRLFFFRKPRDECLASSLRDSGNEKNRGRLLVPGFVRIGRDAEHFTNRLRGLSCHAFSVIFKSLNCVLINAGSSSQTATRPTAHVPFASDSLPARPAYRKRLRVETQGTHRQQDSQVTSVG